MASHEDAARLMKVFRLADAFERMCHNCEVHDPAEVAETASAYRDDEWRLLAKVVGVNPPSDETIRLTKFFLRKRAEEAENDDPFRGLS